MSKILCKLLEVIAKDQLEKNTTAK